jgi:hypothetical protein
VLVTLFGSSPDPFGDWRKSFPQANIGSCRQYSWPINFEVLAFTKLPLALAATDEAAD